MIAGRRARANHLNAQKSTGPRSIEGKQRSAKNARQHGLSLPVTSDPEISIEVERLALIIAGEDAGPRRLEAARDIAESQIALIRLHRVRLLLLNHPGGQIQQANVAEEIKGRYQIQCPKDPDAISRVKDTKDRQGREIAPKLTAGLDLLAPKLMRLDRYERRALSRRKKAIRLFDLVSEPVSTHMKEDSGTRLQVRPFEKNEQKIIGEQAL